MKKVFASALIALVAFVACNGEDLPPVDQGDQNQTKTPGGEEPGENPGGEQEPPAVFEWPNDPAAFDYGLDNGKSRRAGYLTAAERDAVGIISNKKTTEPATLDDITYGTGAFFQGNRMAISKVNVEWSEDYPDVIPSQNYQSFKINRPGTVSFFQSLGSGIDRIPTYYMAVVTTINGVTSAKIVDSFRPEATGVIDGKQTSGRPNTPYADDTFKDYIVTLAVSEDDLKGISEAATVYIYHRFTTGNTCDVLYYPLGWTANGEGSSSAQRKGKFLLAGDSLVTEYGESSAPQTGWGQCLSEALGGGVQVNNHAVGGESTKSFIDSGKWNGLISSTLAGDIVMIQFMHNDQKTDEAHATDPATTYRENLKKFIKEVKERGATPVLVTSVLRRQFKNGVLVRNLGNFPDAMRAVAAETNVSLIDCEQWSYEWLTGLGEGGSEPYYVTNKRDPEKNDNTHFTKEGAEIVAKFIADEIVRLGIWSK